MSGWRREDALGRPLVDIFSRKAVHAIRNRITLLRGADAVERLFGSGADAGRRAVRRGGAFLRPLVVIEAEPAVVEEMEASRHGARHDRARRPEPTASPPSCAKAPARCAP